jgi:hypothetical protein
MRLILTFNIDLRTPVATEKKQKVGIKPPVPKCQAHA